MPVYAVAALVCYSLDVTGDYKLLRTIIFIGRILIFVFVCWFGYEVVAETTDDDAANRALFVALMLHVLVWGLTAVRKDLIQKQVWKYAASQYRQYPTSLLEQPETPIDFSLASPLLEQGVRALQLDDIYEVGLPRGRLGFLTKIRSTRSLFGGTGMERGDYMLEYLVLAVKLNTPTPHIFIDGRSQNRFGGRSTDLWSLTKRLSRHDKLQDLEGDFPKYFGVYCPEKQYLSALSIATPDVMLAMSDQGYSFDYEIHDGVLYVIHESTFESVDEFKAMTVAAQACLAELIPQITKHHYDDAGQELRVLSGRLNLWAILYSLRIMGWYFVKILAVLLAGIMIGGLFRGGIALT